MKHRMALVGLAGLLSLALVAPASAQGWGRGAGMGRRGQGARMGMGYAGRGQGGWWARVNPTTPEQQALVAQVTDLHNQIRKLNYEIWQLRASDPANPEIAKREQAVASLRAELAKVTSANETVIRQLGVPAPYGVCNGQGLGRGAGAGRGWGGARGNGLGLRDGSGPNPNCPLKRK